MCIYHIFLIHSSVIGHLGCFHVLAIANSAAMNTWLHVSFLRKEQQITNIGEGVEKREPSYTVGGNVNWYTHSGEQYGGTSEN